MARKMSLPLLLMAVSVAGAAAPAVAEAKKAGEPKAAPTAVSAAILDYETSAPGNRELGSQIADILTARLSVEEYLELVERAKLGEVLKEQKLKLVGLVSQEQAAKVGRLVGAQLLVIGKTFVMDKKLMIITKIVGVETGRVVGGVRQAELSKPISEAIMLLAEDIAKLVRKNAVKLLPKSITLLDPIADLRKALAGKSLPKVAVVIPERHITRIVVDPAVETEIKKTLIACGVTVLDTGKNDLADWAKKMLKDKKRPWPAALSQADYVIVGEAFSEFALRTGDLVTCAARAEINVIDRKTGRIVLADRHSDRAVDLAEALAGKTALQKAGRKLSIRILTHFAKALPAAKAAK